MPTARSLRVHVRGLLAAVLCGGIALAVAAGGPRSAAADEGAPEVTVTEGQRATVVGRGPSVRAVIEQLCWQANVPLQYDGDDEPFASDQRDQPLEKVLSRLLHRRDFVLAVHREEPDGALRVTSLHVLGASGSLHRREGGSTLDAAAIPRFTIPGEMLKAAFADGDAASREHAMTALMEDVLGNPVRLQSFLAADVPTMADALRPYPIAPAMLERMSASPRLNTAMRNKINALIAALK